ncbi:hypothetical protein BJ170DRAFT_625129 [Xylariales sp. AK1849]|nr:hypothetical protein BJ170DRAFT_625129 [Xylariales sp. AK1849]
MERHYCFDIIPNVMGRSKELSPQIGCRICGSRSTGDGATKIHWLHSRQHNQNDYRLERLRQNNLSRSRFGRLESFLKIATGPTISVTHGDPSIRHQDHFPAVYDKIKARPLRYICTSRDG